MERRAWQATVHGVTAVGHNLATKPPSYNLDILCTLDTHHTIQHTLQPFFNVRGNWFQGPPHSHQLPGFMDAEVPVSILLNSLHHLSITYNT